MALSDPGSGAGLAAAAIASSSSSLGSSGAGDISASEPAIPGMQMSLSPYSLQSFEAAKHDHDLAPDAFTHVHLDAAHMGVGGDDSWSPTGGMVAPMAQQRRLACKGLCLPARPPSWQTARSALWWCCRRASALGAVLRRTVNMIRGCTTQQERRPVSCTVLPERQRAEPVLLAPGHARPACPSAALRRHLPCCAFPVPGPLQAALSPYRHLTCPSNQHVCKYPRLQHVCSAP